MAHSSSVGSRALSLRDLQRQLAALLPDARTAGGESTLEMVSQRNDAPRLTSATVLEEGILRARQIPDAVPTSAFRAFIDGTQRSTVATYVGNVAVVLGGPFNSGILATGAVPIAGQTAYFDYGPASPSMISHVSALEAVCARHGVPLRAAALQFPAAHPAVAVVLAGARNETEVNDLVAMRRHAIPPGFWVELRERGLIAPAAPLPNQPS